MKIILTEQQVMKIISGLSVEDIEQRLEYNWSTWAVERVGVDTFSLTKAEAKKT